MDIQLFLLLLGGHYLADFGLQTKHMAMVKGQAFLTVVGFHNLTAHAAIHGLVTGLITQNMTAAIIVGLSHWVIDFLKASVLITNKFPHTKGARKNGQQTGIYGLNIDQALHVSILVLVAVALS
jgi:hypothetical protein